MPVIDGLLCRDFHVGEHHIGVPATTFTNHFYE